VRTQRRAARTVVLGVVSLALLQAVTAGAVAARDGVDPARTGSPPTVADVREDPTLRSSDRAVLSVLPDLARLSRHAATGRVRFLAGAPGAPLLSAARVRLLAEARGLALTSLDRPLAPALAARAALEEVGPLFGVDRPSTDLDVDRVADATDGRRVVRMAQERGGIPVIGGELVVHVGPLGDVLSVAGEAVPSGDAVTTTPSIPPEVAREEARAAVAAASSVASSALRTSVPELAIHDPRILGGEGLPRPSLVWRITVSADAPRVSELVLVDASRGSIATTVPLLAHARERRVCDFRNVRREEFACTGGYERVEGQGPAGLAEVDRVYRAMGQVYAFWRDRFGRDSLDGAGMPLVATVRYCMPTWCPMRNAFWDWEKEQATFGDGWAAADDIVGHEYMHGLLDHGARLFYYYQSGAINEGFADIFGELLDLTNGTGDDGAGRRWLIGEDTLGSPILRDMQHPPNYGDPDRMRSTRYATSSSDEGGVHTNSGVLNKAAALLVDGGSFNGRHVRGLGITKAGWILYETALHRLTSASDFADLFDAMQQACVDLVGTAGIRLTACDEVRDAVLATEMHLPPPAAVPRTAPVCGAKYSRVDAFHDDMEEPELGRWQRVAIGDSPVTWYHPQNAHPYPEWDATWASSGKQNLFGDDPKIRSSSAIVLSDAVTVPEGGFLHWQHGWSFDANGGRPRDGGIVELQVDGGEWQNAGPRFTHGGYTGTIATGRSNPLAGRRAFTRSSYGYGSSRVDLADLAGRSVRVRFRTGTDTSVAAYGWYIDDVRIYRCAPKADQP
jgi:Zn-dependent metalloprotease